MNIYIYQADVYCERCGKEFCKQNVKPNYPPPYDTDDYPYGPISNGGGEADYPQHCGNCNMFLCNPLTEDGENYVIEVVKNAFSDSKGDGLKGVPKIWRRFYSYLNFKK